MQLNFAEKKYDSHYFRAHCLYINSSGGFATKTIVVARVHNLTTDSNQEFLTTKEVFVHPAYVFGDSHGR